MGLNVGLGQDKSAAFGLAKRLRALEFFQVEACDAARCAACDGSERKTCRP